MRYTLGEIAEIIGGKLRGVDPSIEVRGISTDTRTLRKGEIFFALEGERFDGSMFIKDAIRRGAPAAVAPSGYEGEEPVIEVDDPLIALGKLAAHHRLSLKNLKVIAVTGSVGKTTTKDLIYHLLKDSFKTQKSPKSFNNFVGVPLTIFKADEETACLVAEAGINRKGEMQHLAMILNPDIAVLTRVGRAHVGYLGSMEDIAWEKSALFKRIRTGGTAILNADSPYVEIFEKAVPDGVRIFFYGIEKGDLKPDSCDFQEKRTEFVLKGEKIIVPKPGRGMLEDALAAISVALTFGIDLKTIGKRLATFEGSPMRMQISEIRGIEIVNDAYNANPDSMIELFRAFPETGNRRNIFVLGDMLELGDEAEELHREIGRAFSEFDHRILIAIGPLAREMARSAKEAGVEKVYSFLDINEAIEFIKAFVKPGDRLLLKASRLVELERIEQALKEED